LAALDQYINSGRNAGRETLADRIEEITGFKLTPFQRRAIKLVEEKPTKNVLVVAPTGSGKTVIAYAALLLHGKGFYLAPLIAIMNEKYMEMVKLFEPRGYTVSITNRDYRVPPSTLLRSNFKIMSPYKFISYFRLIDPDRHGRVVVVDEFHKISRDPLFEAAITLAKSHGFRIIGLSATIHPDDIVYLRKWLDAEVVASEERPVSLELHPAPVVLSSTGRYVACTDIVYRGRPVLHRGETFRWRTDIAATIAARLYFISRRPVIVWAPTRRMVEEIALKIADMLPEQPHYVELAGELKPGNASERLLRYTLSRGVWIHHGGLSYNVRHFVEENYRRCGGIIVTAYTLSHGVNLPGTFLVMSTIRDYKGQVLDASTFHQIAGRAGRPGYDEQGYVIVVVVGSAELEVFKYYVRARASRIEPTLLDDPYALTKLALPVYAAGGWGAVKRIVTESLAYLRYSDKVNIDNILAPVREAVEFYEKLGRARPVKVAIEMGLHPLEYEAIVEILKSQEYKEAVEAALMSVCMILGVNPEKVYDDIMEYGFLAAWLGSPEARSVADHIQTLLEAGAYWAGAVYGWQSSERAKMVEIAKKFAYAGNPRVEPLAREIPVNRLRRMIKAVPQIVRGAQPEDATQLVPVAVKEAYIFARRVYRKKLARLVKLTYYAMTGMEPQPQILQQMVETVVKELKKSNPSLQVF